MIESMKIHCIGIGGIGLSALARYYKTQGHIVTGSDTGSSELINTLQKEGISVAFGHAAENVADDVDLVVYTIAAQDSNVELVKAKSRGMLTKTYPQALGDITKDKTTITVSGTHGKTTTTAMMYYAMKACGINPTVIVGSLLSDHGTNFVAGDSNYMIVEACEYKRSFLNLHPTHAVITNIDEDHLDYYKDLDDIKSAFQSFVDLIPVEGSLTTHDDVVLETLAKKVNADLWDASSIELSVLGEHNRHNAQLVLAFLMSLHFDEKKIRAGLKEFKGTWRRMEYKGKTLHGIPVYDDYGHHPREISATVEALREKYPAGKNKISMLFQPHLYSRTKALLPEFVDVLKEVDEVHILPIYRARLEDTSIINEDSVVMAINQAGGNAKKFESLADIPAYVESITNPATVIVNMGAGNAFEELNKVTLL
jgi:UDP-N-acetylmuramate--alanine ligase